MLTIGRGAKLYTISIDTGLAWVATFKVYADNEQEAVDTVADYIDKYEDHLMYSDHYTLADLCEVGQTVDEYAEAHNLICAGTHGIYLEVIGLEVSDDEDGNI